MLRNYFKIAIRNLIKNKVSSFVSIGGLALGISTCILLVLFIHFEHSFDSLHSNANRIFRVITKVEKSNGSASLRARTPDQAGPELANSFPEIQHIVRVTAGEVKLIQESEYSSQQVLFSDQEFFKIFSFRLLSGNPESALSNPFSVVLTKSKAIQLLGTTDVIGKEIEVQLYEDIFYFQVTGIAADPPANSSINFEMIFPYQSYSKTKSPIFQKIMSQRWDFLNTESYLLLNTNSSVAQLEHKLPEFVATHYKEQGRNTTLQLQPLSDIYLNPEVQSTVTKTTSPINSWVLFGIAIIILIIACVNFMSLTLSDSSNRLSEIGVRKSAGASIIEIGIQFMGEALISCFLAFLLGTILAEFSLPYFRELVEKPIPFVLSSSPGIWIYLAILILSSALVTGLYPAFVLAKKRTTDSLKDANTIQKIPVLVKGLIVAQFTIAITFIPSSMVMHKQMNYLLTKDIGFEQNNILLIKPGTDTNKAKDIYQIFEHKVRTLPGVKNISASYSSYGSPLLFPRLKIDDGSTMEVGLDVADNHFLETLGIKLIEGRDFNEQYPSDIQNGAIVNKSFVERMNWEEPIGKEIPLVDIPNNLKGKGSLQETMLSNKKVIGVVEDFHYESLFSPMKPLVLVNNKNLGSGVASIWLRVEPSLLPETLNRLSSAWKEAAPTESFNYSFLNDVIRRQYSNEKKWSKVIDIASLLAISLACFGLFGIAAMTTLRRKKEIGIRKVLGASISSIITLLSKDFLWLVFLAILIGCPVSWFIMNKWLSGFAYKIKLDPNAFFIAGIGMIFIALATISWQSFRAASANPVDSLKNE